MIFAASALEHVSDSYDWHFIEKHLQWTIPLPAFRDSVVFGQKGFGISKYAILMFMAAGLIAWIYIPLAKKIQTGEAPRGIFWNLFEAILTFIRDNVAKPYIGKHADDYVHYLWTAFLFILFCNLFGMTPFLGAPTASFSITFILAMSVFVFIHVSSIVRYGFKNHLLSFAPHLDMPYAMRVCIYFLLWPIEFLGLGLKCFVLAIRLFANLFAGHIVSATILLFIPMAMNESVAIQSTVTVASVLGVFALSFLELFVAFIQAFIFVFLTALFLGGVLEHAAHTAHGHEGHEGHDGHDGHAPPAVAGEHH